MVDGRNSWIYFIHKRLSGSGWRVLQTLNNTASNCLGTPPPVVLTLDVFGMSPTTFYTAFSSRCSHTPRAPKSVTFFMKSRKVKWKKDKARWDRGVKGPSFASPFSPLINTHVMTLVERKVRCRCPQSVLLHSLSLGAMFSWQRITNGYCWSLMCFWLQILHHFSVKQLQLFVILIWLGKEVWTTWLLFINMYILYLY